MQTLQVTHLFTIDIQGEIPVAFSVPTLQGGESGFYQIDDDIFFFTVGDTSKPIKMLEAIIVPEGAPIDDTYEVDSLIPVFYSTADLTKPEDSEQEEADTEDEPEERVMWFAVAIKKPRTDFSQPLSWKRTF